MKSNNIYSENNEANNFFTTSFRICPHLMKNFKSGLNGNVKFESERNLINTIHLTQPS